MNIDPDLPDLVRATTPVAFGLIGMAIGVPSAFNDNTAGVNLAQVCFAGGLSLAQVGRMKSNKVRPDVLPPAAAPQAIAPPEFIHSVPIDQIVSPSPRRVHDDNSDRLVLWSDAA